jgi:hypothetical protein
MHTQQEIDSLWRIAHEFCERIRSNTKARDAVMKAFYDEHEAYKRANDSATVNEYGSKIVNWPNFYREPSSWTKLPEAEKSMFAIYCLGGLADIANPDPVLPWPDTGNCAGLTQQQIDIFRGKWILRLPVSGTGWANEAGARWENRMSVKLSDVRMSIQLLEAMWSHVKALPEFSADAAGTDVEKSELKSLRSGQKASNAPTDEYRPASAFGSKSMSGRLRKAASKSRRSKKARSKVIDGVKCYCVADARKWWPLDVPEHRK